MSKFALLPSLRHTTKARTAPLSGSVKRGVAGIIIVLLTLWGWKLYDEFRQATDYQQKRIQEISTQLATRLNLVLALQAQTALTVLQSPGDSASQFKTLSRALPSLRSLMSLDRDGHPLDGSSGGAGAALFPMLTNRSGGQPYHYSASPDGQATYLILTHSDGYSILVLGPSILPALLEPRAMAHWRIEDTLSRRMLASSDAAKPEEGGQDIALITLTNSDWQLHGLFDAQQLRGNLLPGLLGQFLLGLLLAVLPLAGLWYRQRQLAQAQHANQALLETRRRYQDIFESSGVALCILDLTPLHAGLIQAGVSDANLDSQPELQDALIAKLRITEINQVAMRLLGVDSVIGAWRTLFELSPSQGALRASLLNAMLDGSQPRDVQMESRIYSATGEEHHLWLEMRLPEDTGNYHAVALSISNITSRKHIELARLEREAFWSNVVQTVPDYLYVQDTATQDILYSNYHLGHHLGYALSELAELGPHFWESLMHPEDASVYHRSRKERLANGYTQGLAYQLRLRHHDGSWRWYEIRERVLSRDTEQQVTQVIGVAKDITEQIEAGASLRDSEQRYRMLAESISDVIFSTDPLLNINYVSPSVETVLGYTPEGMIANGFQSIAANPQQLTGVDLLLTRLQKALTSPAQMAELRQQPPNQVFLIDCLRADGRKVPVELRMVLVWDEHGRFEGLLGVGRDVSQQRRAEKDLRMAATVFEHSTSAILITDPAGFIVQANEAFTRVSGYSLAQVIDQLPAMLTVDKQQASHLEYVLKQLHQRGTWEGEVWLKRRNGETYPAWVGITAVLDDEGDLASYVCFFSDISERKASEQRIHRLAYYDALTSLPNRTLFQDRLHSALQHAERQDAFVVLMFLDLDRFKPINDSLGHAAGDRMLKDMATRLLACVNDDDTVARMGGDEFTLLLQPRASRSAALNQAIHVAEQILTSLVTPFVLEGREFFVTASIGIALSPQDGSELSQLMKNADTAMYHAKERGKNNFQFYQADMNASALERLELESDLRHALEQQEFTLYYQPQFSGDGKRLTGAEALLRWRHPRRGLVPPADFIPVLEELGLVVDVGDWVLMEACRQLKAWHLARVRVPKISVNISARQFADGNLGNRIAATLEEVSLAPACLELELTESVLMSDVGVAMQILDGLKRLGLSIAVDDFGTGYSSLNYLKQFPIDVLKIDQSFVDGLPAGEQDAQIARAIIAMAHSLNLSVIAEGVETHEQLEFLREHGCDEVQGFLFGRPMPANHFEAQFSNDALFMLE